MPWKKGQSGNLQGRPKKKRALAEILTRAGSKTIEDCDGKRRSGKRIVARLLWQAATTGVVQFPGAEKATVIPLSDWLGIVKFLYAHIDGPPKQTLDLIPGEGSLTITLDWGDSGDTNSEAADSTS